MKICQSHWDAMRTKLKELGIDHLGAKNATEAVYNFEESIARGPGEPTPSEEWDPLMVMNLNFWDRAIQIMGLDALDPEFGCPLCRMREVWEHHHPETKSGRCGDQNCLIYLPPGTPPTDQDWIDNCGEVLRKGAVKRGLVKLS